MCSRKVIYRATIIKTEAAMKYFSQIGIDEW
jgi:hypothetical protein